MSRRIHDQRLIRALRALNSELAASNRAVAARTGLNDSDLAVLDVLHRDGPQTPTSLARRTRMGTTTMTSVLRRLVRDGWVERRPSETDLRSFTIHATSVDRLAEIFLPANRRLTALVENWPGSRVDQLIEFLEDATTVIHESADPLSRDNTQGP
nr:MarR family transcriptional regulator [uncultured Actinomyces sp.]